jgi:hypothetical protein
LKYFILLSFISALALSTQTFAQGGPPLVTDDPGTPGDAHWEINSAVQWSPTSEGGSLLAPLFDINYGWGDRIQLNVVTSWNTQFEKNVTSPSGLSTASLAVKWRFIDEKNAGFNLSMYPRADVHYGLASDDAAVNTPGTRYFMPFEFSKQIGRYGVNFEAGYGWSSSDNIPAEWDYGAAFNYEVADEKEFLFEVHGRDLNSTNGREELAGVGTRWAMREGLSFIGAIEHSFSVYETELPFWLIYLGVQSRF